MSYEECVKAMRASAVEFGLVLEKVRKQNSEVVLKTQIALEGINGLLGYARTDPVHNPRRCTVCVTREVARALSPCGHVFCNSCAGRAERSRCHTCRTPVINTLRVYL